VPIRPFLRNESFDPEIITLMGVAFEKACSSISVPDQSTRELVAKKIVELAQRGERDPIRMSEHALKELGIGR
jgi:hypothetical protein